MARYLHTFSYSKEAVKGYVSKPKNRIEVGRSLIEAVDGRLIDANCTLGDSDGIIISEFPADVDALIVLMAVGSAGAIADFSTTTTMIHIDDVVNAVEKFGILAGAYRLPGQ